MAPSIDCLPQQTLFAANFNPSTELDNIVGTCKQGRSDQQRLSAPLDADPDALLALQHEIRTRLAGNDSFFSSRIADFKDPSTQAMLISIQKQAEHEASRHSQSQAPLARISSRIQARAGRIFELAEEKRAILESITKLKQLHMISSGLGLIESHRRGRRYREIANIFMAAEQLSSTFQNGNDTGSPEDPVMAALLARLASYRVGVGRDVVALFQSGFDDQGRVLADDPFVLAGCCLCADVLENNHRAVLIKIFLEKQFTAYRKLFPASMQVSELKSLQNRFAWSKRLLTAFDTVYALIFPSDWSVDILIGQACGNWIKEDVATVLSAVPAEKRIDEDLFIKSLSDANSFDRFVNLKFRGQFVSTVAAIFQDYHYFLFEAKEEQFKALMGKHLPKDCTKALSKVLKKDQLVLASFDQFFLFFSGMLEDYVHLSKGLLLIHLTFFVGESLEALRKHLHSQLDLITAKSTKKYSADLAKLTCAIVSTCDYCSASSQELRERIVAALENEEHQSHASFEPVQQQFLITRSVGLAQLIARLDEDTAKPFASFSKTNWLEALQVHDISPFYLACVDVFEQTATMSLPSLARCLQPATCRVFFEKLVNWFVLKLRQTLWKFKHVPETGAEQLLLDLFAFRTYFSHKLPPATWSPKDLAEWSASVTKAVASYETLLKVLLTPTEPVAPFVQSYLLLLADFDLEGFTRLLELKGLVKRSDQVPYLDEFSRHAPPTPLGESPLHRRHSIQSIKGTNTASWSKYYEMGEDFMLRLRSLSLSSISFRGYSRRPITPQKPNEQGQQSHIY